MIYYYIYTIIDIIMSCQAVGGRAVVDREAARAARWPQDYYYYY